MIGEMSARIVSSSGLMMQSRDMTVNTTGKEALGTHIEGWMGPDELVWLADRATTMKSIVEIGSWQGRSLFALCSACPGKVYAVDHFLGSEEHQEKMKDPGFDLYAVFMKNVGHFANLKVMRMTSKQAAKKIRRTVQMVFIDGAHDFDSVRRDVILWTPKATRLICGHDSGYGSVMSVLTEYFPNQWKQGPGSIWYVEK